MNDFFDRSQLLLEPLAQRIHKLQLDAILPLRPRPVELKNLATVAEKIVTARQKQAAVVLMMGAHVLRSGVQRYLIDLMERGLVTCIALNGAGIIHDFEFALVGATTEDVGTYIRDGRFGMWQETGRINEIVAAAARENRGLGEAVGRVIEEENFPHRDISVVAAGYRLGIPVTVHVGLGQDIIHQHPNCDGAAFGATSYLDFLRFTRCLQSLENGVVMNFGSAVMAPEVYLKALAMVRNVARQQSETISRFTTLVCDKVRLPDNFRQEPSPDEPGYYFRPWKTMLVRTVADGGESFYVQGNHAATIPQLWSALTANPQ